MDEGRRPEGPKDWQALKRELLQALPALGIDKLGVTTAEPFWELRERLLAHRKAGRESGFEEPDLDKRVNPELHLAGARSILSVAVAYPSKLPDPPRSEPGAYRGILARSAWGRDYHHVLRDRLERLEAFLRERVPDARIVSMVDTGALSDRAVAVRAGIGWSGKNCAVITPEFGSWVYLGEMITDLPLPPDPPVVDGCGDCTLCIDACPTGALVGPGQLDAKRCVSFLTQTKEIIPEEFREKLGNRLYGCDTCQQVCPKNRGLNHTHHRELVPDPEQAKPLLLPILDMSNKEFKAFFGSSAAAWRGKKPLQRNAVLALGHFRDRSALPRLALVLAEDERPELRATAAWSIGRIGGEEAVRVLEAALLRETDDAAAQEIRLALDRLTEAK
ncbi:tRNA epoxyqueuosine(34) reductase QueG [Gorillibacterium sp. sgz5001074]|uniref:tRNA epoxyqueuosine(34) reductase QueG n=1 Tax=Gorillibacterium sp. sgz5001074 TaxID=3446695 RepID=UPI003F67DF19